MSFKSVCNHFDFDGMVMGLFRNGGFDKLLASAVLWSATPRRREPLRVYAFVQEHTHGIVLALYPCRPHDK
eukprot:2134321-Amphidinium_carterae.1